MAVQRLHYDVASSSMDMSNSWQMLHAAADAKLRALCSSRYVQAFCA